MEIIDGRKISKEILAEVKVKVKTLDFKPVFCDILVGNDLASLKYVELKKKKALELGIDFYDANFTENITTEELILEIEKINKIENMCGIIVQLPLPSHLDTQKILDTIEPSLDVDCLGEELSNKFYNGDLFIAPPTALACEALLESLNLDLLKKKILIIGEGKLVGKPMANILKFKNYNFDIINSKSENQETLIKEADVLITGVGARFGRGKEMRTSRRSYQEEACNSHPAQTRVRLQPPRSQYRPLLAFLLLLDGSRTLRARRLRLGWIFPSCISPRSESRSACR
jgi:methylenetetrahydrofolate dehydrogenase (NADP+)/methenyltetrahydrofolate cyclohydrolase